MNHNHNQEPEWLGKRNYRLSRFWAMLGLPIRLIGGEQKPAMIFDERWILSCYVKNFDLVFLDKNDGGAEVFSVKLKETPEFSPSAIIKWLSESSHKPVFRIFVEGSTPKLYLCGYNYMDSENCQGRYPVFANKNPKIYFTEQTAKEKASILINEGYTSLKVIKPALSTIDLRKYAT